MISSLMIFRNLRADANRPKISYYERKVERMKDIQLRELHRNTAQYADKEIVVRGWVRTNRSSNKFGFIEINDGTFFKSVQIVYEADKIDNFDQIAKALISSALMVRGTVTLTPEAKQPFEIKAAEVVIEADSAADYPLQKKRHSMEFMREIAHLRPRSNTFSAVFRVRSLVSYAIHKFFQDNDFVYVHTPIVTGSDCEGAGEMFRITTLDMENPPRTEEGKIDYGEDFFGKETSLTVSGQLEAETFALAFRNVYTFGPTFRAENSYTARHASEFWMIEPEIAFADLEDNMELQRPWSNTSSTMFWSMHRKRWSFFNKFMEKGLLERLDDIVNSDFGRVTYTEAVELLKKSGREVPVSCGVGYRPSDRARAISDRRNIQETSICHGLP